MIEITVTPEDFCTALTAREDVELEQLVTTLWDTVVAKINDCEEFVSLPDQSADVIAHVNKLLNARRFSIGRIGDRDRHGNCRYIIKVAESDANQE